MLDRVSVPEVDRDERLWVTALVDGLVVSDEADIRSYEEPSPARWAPRSGPEWPATPWRGSAGEAADEAAAAPYESF